MAHRASAVDRVDVPNMQKQCSRNCTCASDLKPYIPCWRVVGDLMKHAGHRAASVVELDQYLRRPRSIGGRVQVAAQTQFAQNAPAQGLQCLGAAQSACSSMHLASRMCSPHRFKQGERWRGAGCGACTQQQPHVIQQQAHLHRFVFSISSLPSAC